MNLESGEENKETKMIRCAQATLEIISARGLSALSHSRLARSADVSRPWIYKYLGPSQKELIAFAVDHFGKMFSQLDEAEVKGGPDAWLEDFMGGLERLLEDSRKYPWIVPIYFRYKGSDTPLGLRIAHVESLYLDKQARELQACFEVPKEKGMRAAKMLTAFRMGLAHAWWSGALGGELDRAEILRIARKWVQGALATQ